MQEPKNCGRHLFRGSFPDLSWNSVQGLYAIRGLAKASSKILYLEEKYFKLATSNKLFISQTELVTNQTDIIYGILQV